MEPGLALTPFCTGSGRASPGTWRVPFHNFFISRLSLDGQKSRVMGRGARVKGRQQQARGTRLEEINGRYELQVRVRLSEFTVPEGFQELLVWQNGYSLHHPSARSSADTEVTLETLLFGKSP